MSGRRLVGLESALDIGANACSLYSVWWDHLHQGMHSCLMTRPIMSDPSLQTPEQTGSFDARCISRAQISEILVAELLIAIKMGKTVA